MYRANLAICNHCISILGLHFHRRLDAQLQSLLGFNSMSTCLLHAGREGAAATQHLSSPGGSPAHTGQLGRSCLPSRIHSRSHKCSRSCSCAAGYAVRPVCSPCAAGLPVHGTVLMTVVMSVLSSILVGSWQGLHMDSGNNVANYNAERHDAQVRRRTQLRVSSEYQRGNTATKKRTEGPPGLPPVTPNVRKTASRAPA